MAAGSRLSMAADPVQRGRPDACHQQRHMMRQGCSREQSDDGAKEGGAEQNSPVGADREFPKSGWHLHFLANEQKIVSNNLAINLHFW